MRNVFKDKMFLGIFLLGLLLRIFWVTLFPTYPYTDFMWYHVKGVEISQGQGFLNGVYPNYEGVVGKPTAFRPIGYPATLAMVYFFTGDSFLAGKFLNVFLACLSMMLLYIIARKFFSRKISLVSLLLLSLSPLAIIYTGILGSETLFMTLLLLCAYFLLIQRSPIKTGLVVGYMALVRPIGIYFLAAILLFIFLEKNIDWMRKIKQALVIFLVALVVTSPWIIRNYIVFGSPVFSTNGGYVIFVNNNPYATGSWSDPYKYPDSPFLKYRYDTWFDELGMHKEGKELALNWISENPGGFLKLGVKRMIHSYWSKLDDIMWGFTTDMNQWHPFTSRAIRIQKFLFKPFNSLVWMAVFVIMIRGIKGKVHSFDLFMLITFLYFNFMIFVLEGNSRYLFPLFPFYSIWVVWILSKFPRREYWKKLMEEK
jgi:4-amino-4-deoxy-L-arabinose transferase-like glycosyltransferase